MDEKLRFVIDLQNKASAELRKLSKDMDGVKPTAGMRSSANWFQQLETASGGASKAIRPLAAGLSTIGVAGFAAGLSVAGFAKQIRDLADSTATMKELGRQSGMTATEIARLQYVARALHVDPSQMTGAIATWSTGMVAFEKRTGVVYAEMQRGSSGLAEKMRAEYAANPGEAYKDQLKWLAAIPDAQMRAGKSAQEAAQIQKYWVGQVLGDEGMEQIFSKGMDGLTEAYAEAAQKVQPITKEMQDQAELLNKSIVDFDTAWTHFETSVGPTVFKNLRTASDDFRETFQQIEGVVTWIENHKGHVVEDAGQAALNAIDAQAAENKKHPDGIVVDVPGIVSKTLHSPVAQGFSDMAGPSSSPNAGVGPTTLPSTKDAAAGLADGFSKMEAAKPAPVPAGNPADDWSLGAMGGVLMRGLRLLNPVSDAHADEVPQGFKLRSAAGYHPDDDRLSRARPTDLPDRTLDGVVVGALGQEVIHLTGTLKTASAALGGDGIRPAAFHPTGLGGSSSGLDPQAVIAAGTKEGVLAAFRELSGMSGAAGGGGIMPASFGGGGFGGGGGGRAPSIRFGRQHSSAPYDDGGATPTGAHDPLKDLIAQHETGGTGAAGYDTAYGHAERGGPLAPPKPLTQMTIAEVLAYQRAMKPRAGSAAFPVGRAQWTESTLRGLTRGMDQNQPFTADLQEKLFDRSIAGRIGQGSGGFRSEWDSLRAVPDGEIDRAMQGHRDALKNAAPTASATGPRGAYPDWMDDKSKREMAGINAPLARELLAASEATGTHFSILQGMRTEAEASHNAFTGRGVVNSQHRWGAAADIKLTDAQGHALDRAGYANFAHAFQGYSHSHGGNSRWLGGIGGRWSSDIAHFDQGIGYGQTHNRDPYGAGGPTAADIAAGNKEIFSGPDNPFLRAAKPLGEAADKLKAVVAPMPAVAPEPPRLDASAGQRAQIDPVRIDLHHHESGKTRIAARTGKGVQLSIRTAPTLVQTA